MPKSPIRRKAAYTPPPTRSATRLESPRWFGVVIIALMLFGLAWLVTFYISNASNSHVPLITDLGNWNILIGFTFIMSGFVLLTRWR